jgi:DNA-directed RNA polymerase subunit H (RpoH/RPB5)
VCTEEEKAQVLHLYKVTAKQLPGIEVADPMVRYLGARKGQLVRVTRKGKIIQGETLFYRIVV